ncbi:hypothetical protein BC834DRAFT_46203 [Gloeopeniophorella convolvens]|nr:hypothetical protein BC834DRAFT_46203 [Gloeopeniophorella convolvens]
MYSSTSFSGTMLLSLHTQVALASRAIVNYLSRLHHCHFETRTSFHAPDASPMSHVGRKSRKRASGTGSSGAPRMKRGILYFRHGHWQPLTAQGDDAPDAELHPQSLA